MSEGRPKRDAASAAAAAAASAPPTRPTIRPIGEKVGWQESGSSGTAEPQIDCGQTHAEPAAERTCPPSQSGGEPYRTVGESAMSTPSVFAGDVFFAVFEGSRE